MELNEKTLIRYAQAAKNAGCPRAQLENFLRAGLVLQPRQLQASAAARECDRDGGPTKILFGGARGGGKSYWSIAQVAADDCQRYPGLKWLFLRKVGKSARESFEDLRLKVLVNLPHRYNRNEGLVVFENGSRIILGHFQNESDIDAYLGVEYDGIITEEATTLTARKLTGISTCCRTSKPGWRPREYYTTNPGGVGHSHVKGEFIEPYRRGGERGTRFVPSTVEDNRFVNPEYRGTLENLVGWLREAWLRGNWDIAAGQFFTNFDRAVHVIPVREIPRSAVWGCGLDYGFTHYTSVHLLATWDGAVFVVDEHAERRWLPVQHAGAVKALLGRNGLALHNLSFFVAGADVFSRDRDGKTIAEDYAGQGIALTAANMDRVNGAGEILKLLGNAEVGIAPRLFIFDRCARLIECLPALQHDPHRPEDVLKWDTDEDGEGGDDPYDSLRYGVMEIGRAGASYQYDYLTGAVNGRKEDRGEW